MKNYLRTFKKTYFFKAFLVVSLLFFIPQQAEAQFLKKLAKKAKEKVEREADKRSEERVNNKIDEGFDKVEDEIDGKNQENKKIDESPTGEGVNESQSGTSKSNSVVWSRFDFVPGDEVIFEDSPSNDEENGEFPSRWDLRIGNIEIVEFDGEKVIMSLESGEIVPYLKNSKEDYLPEVFTVEFDVYFAKGSDDHRYYLDLWDKKNQTNELEYGSQAEIFANGIEVGNSESRYPGTENRNWANEPDGKWRHISIAYTKGKYKAYMDDARLINIPHLEGNPTGMTLKFNNDNMYAKNFRIAKGGVKYYDRVLSDGKIIVNGIKFDVNKATLKPESMGSINNIYTIMVDNPELNFSVEGHTDSDGDEAHNQTLSEERAKTVMNQLINMGIDKERLKSAGYGESKPIDNNSTPEGKANNRRVEFVKF